MTTGTSSGPQTELTERQMHLVVDNESFRFTFPTTLEQTPKSEATAIHKGLGPYQQRTLGLGDQGVAL